MGWPCAYGRLFDEEGVGKAAGFFIPFDEVAINLCVLRLRECRFLSRNLVRRVKPFPGQLLVVNTKSQVQQKKVFAV